MMTDSANNSRLERIGLLYVQQQRKLEKARQRMLVAAEQDLLSKDAVYQEAVTERKKACRLIKEARSRQTKKTKRIERLQRRLAQEMELVQAARSQERTALERRGALDLTIAVHAKQAKDDAIAHLVESKN